MNSADSRRCTTSNSRGRRLRGFVSLLLVVHDLSKSRAFRHFSATRRPRSDLDSSLPPPSSGYRALSGRHSSSYSLHLLAPQQVECFEQVLSPRRVKPAYHLKRSACHPLLALPSLPLPSTPLVGAADAWGNWAVLLGSAAAAQVWGTTTPLGRLLGPPVSAMALAFALATAGVLTPGGTAAAQELQSLALQLATPLILLGASNALRRDAARQCGPLLLSFALASLATVAACLVGWLVAGPALQSALGARDGLVVAAALLAKNVGGGINYIAVCQALQASPTAVAAGLCVDNLYALVYFPATSALASGRPDVTTTAMEGAPLNMSSSLSPTASSTEVSVQSVTNVLCGAAALLWLSDKFLGGGLPACTLLTLLVARVAPRAWLAPLQGPAECLGTVALYVFFATAGAPGLAVAESVRASLLPLGAFLACLYSVHGSLLYVANQLGRHLPPRLRLAVAPQRLLVASSAAIGGPATAVALAQASNWESLKVPSLLVGNLGYAVATFCGLAYFALLRGDGIGSGLGAATSAASLRVV